MLLVTPILKTNEANADNPIWNGGTTHAWRLCLGNAVLVYVLKGELDTHDPKAFSMFSLERRNGMITMSGEDTVSPPLRSIQWNSTHSGTSEEQCKHGRLFQSPLAQVTLVVVT